MVLADDGARALVVTSTVGCTKYPTESCASRLRPHALDAVERGLANDGAEEVFELGGIADLEVRGLGGELLTAAPLLPQRMGHDQARSCISGPLLERAAPGLDDCVHHVRGGVPTCQCLPRPCHPSCEIYLDIGRYVLLQLARDVGAVGEVQRGEASVPSA